MKSRVTTHNSKQTSHEEQMRQRIKNEAFNLMAKKGLDKVSMREIAQKLKVTKPVLYYYFKNKEDLCSSIIAQYTQAFAREISQVWDTTHQPEEVIKKACQIQQRFYAENPNRSRFAIQMLAYSLGLPAKVLVRSNNSSPHVVLQQLLRRNVKKDQGSLAAVEDMGMILSALSADMMLNAYLHQHLGQWLNKSRLTREYTQERVDRLIKIMLLGIQAYYRGKNNL